MKSIVCEGCGQPTPPYEVIHCGSEGARYRELCRQCFNEQIANQAGLDGFEHVRLDPISMTDINGAAHEFHFRSYLFGSGLSLEAFELRDDIPGGHMFRVIGEPEKDALVLLARLVEKMRRALAVRHIEASRHGLQVTDGLIVRARVESSTSDDDYDNRTPTVVIDGQEVSWADFGRMMATFEGWQFKMEIRDMSDEI